MTHEHDIISLVAITNEEWEKTPKGRLLWFNCVDHPTKRIPKLYPCYTTIVDYVHEGSINFVGDYHFLDVDDNDVLYYRRENHESKSPMRAPV